MQQFIDRADAGRQLAAALPELDRNHTVVCAVPRGGVPVAAEICRRHQLPLEVIFVRKIGAPGQPELALGAVTDGATPQFIVNARIAKSFGLSPVDVKAIGRQLLPEIERRRRLYLGAREATNLVGKTLIVTDDGMATGATLRVALAALKSVGAARIIVALPLAPAEELATLATLADEVICLYTPRPFYGVGAGYSTFPRTSEAVVISAMAEFAPDADDGHDGG